MADIDEEQLLNDVLETIASEDAQLDASHLEASVLASFPNQRADRQRRSRAWMWLPAAAAVIIAFGISVRPKPDAGVRPEPGTPAMTGAGTATARTATDVTIDRAPHAAARPARSSRQQHTRAREVQAAGSPETATHTPPVAQSPLATPAIEFVPLMPLTEHELTGSFQIVRMQMPGASLGALRSPLVQPDEMVEADVLLGEDGRARAIRVNANESIYPWRPRR